METNVIYLSDASYDASTREAGLAIKNLYTGMSFCISVKAHSIREAEEFALLEAINHALTHEHRNCVFVYDHLGIDVKRLESFYGEMFDQIQFLWMKRDYLSQVDVLAFNVRCKASPHPSLCKEIITYASTLRDEELVCTFMGLTRGETYGYLCAISGTAPSMREYPSTYKCVNEKVISLLMHAGSRTLRQKLQERFGTTRQYKYAQLDEMLCNSGFTMDWFTEAAYECRGLLCAG